MLNKTKNKFRKVSKCFTIFAMIFTMIFSNLAIVNAADYSGDMWVYQIDTGLHYQNSHSSKYGILGRKIRTSTDSSWADARQVFCTEWGVDLATGKFVGYYYTSNMPESYQQATRIAWVGWYAKYGDTLLDSTNIATLKYDYAFTQMMIWESLGYVPGPFTDSGVQARYEAFKVDVNNQIASKSKNPSFYGASLEVDAGDSITLTDINGVLSGFNSCDATLNGVRFQHDSGSNNLTITVNEDCVLENYTLTRGNAINIGLYKHEGGNDFRHYYFGEHQDNLYTNMYPDDPTLTLQLKINLFGSIELQKEYANTETGRFGDATLKDAEYQLIANETITVGGTTYNKGDVVQTAKTNDSGKILFDKVKKGQYIIKETIASEGCLVDVDKDVTVVPAQNLNVISKETVKQQRVEIFKAGIGQGDHASGTIKGLNGAEFTIKLKSDVDTLGWDKAPTYSKVTTTNDDDGESGYATTPLLPFGTYIMRETYTPSDYVTAPDHIFNITKNSDKVKHIAINNDVVSSYIDLVKEDKDTGKIVSLNSATFQIKKEDGTIVKQKVGSKTYDTFTTNSKNVVIPADSYSSKDDENGSVTTPLKLSAGTYTIDEVKVPNGYLDMEDKITFTIDNKYDFTTDEQKDNHIKVVIKNSKPTGSLEVQKSVELNENVDTSLFIEPKPMSFDDYTDLSNLSDIKFRLTAKENILDMADGSVIYAKGATVGEYNLSRYGELTVNDLPMGTYELQEIVTLDGLVLDETKHEVKFTQEDTTTKVYTVSKELVNKPTLVELSKTDVTTSDKELEGASLQVIDKNGKIVDEWISTDKPHTIEGLKVNETYTLREDLAPLGYVKSTDIEFTVKNTDEIQKVHMVDKIMTINKTDVNSKGLEGATLQVLDKDGQIVDEWITDASGNHKVNNLVAGKTYTLREVSSPNNYATAKDITFTVQDDKKDQSLNMIDKKVIISKQDMGGNELQGASMQILDKEGNVVEEWISTDTPYETSNLKVGETYILKEDLSPLGYAVSNTFEFTVNDDGVNQNEKMIDNVVRVAKVDNEGKYLSGATLQVVSKTTKNIVDQWISGQNIITVTDEMKAKLDKTGTISGEVTIGEATKEYTITKSGRESKEVTYSLMLVDSETKETSYYDIDENGNETTHMIRGLQEDMEYTLIEVSAPNDYVIAKSKDFTMKDKDINLEMVDKQVTVKKTDLVTGDEVEGAELTVTDKETGEIVDQWISTKEEHYVSNLEEGKTYILTETVAPNGYYVAESIEFVVSDDKEIQKIEMKDAPILTNIQVNKVDANTKQAIKSKDFAFTMYEDEACTKVITTVHADKENGTATFTSVRYGTVYIKETEAPEGYLLSNEVKKVVLDNNLEGIGETYSFEYVNSLAPIVSTGDNQNINSYLLLGGLSILALGGIVLLKTKKLKSDKD